MTPKPKRDAREIAERVISLTEGEMSLWIYTVKGGKPYTTICSAKDLRLLATAALKPRGRGKKA